MVKTTTAALAAFVLMTAACGDATGPSGSTGLFGWAVGSRSDGYAFIAATGDGGITWSRQGDGSLPDVQLEGVRALDSLTAWAVGDVADGYGTVLRTTDGGETWVRLGTSQELPACGLNGVSPLDADRAYVAGCDNTVLYTGDGGGTWVSLSDPAYAGYDYDCVLALSGSVLWLVGGNEQEGVILRSTDGGASWESRGDSLLLSGYPLITLSAVSESEAWVVGHGYTVARTTDAGESWTLHVPDGLERSPFSDDANGVAALADGRVVVSMDYGKLYASVDSGRSWTGQQVEMQDFLLGVCAMPDGHAWVAGTSSSFDGGSLQHTSTWGPQWYVQDIPDCPALRDVHFVGAVH